MVALPRAIINLDDFTESKNIMIYADTGAGKTMLTAGLPGKVLIITSENGTVVIKKWLAKYGPQVGLGPNDAKRFKMWVVKKWDDLEEAYVWIRDNPGVFDWIVLDSATSLQMRAMRAAMEKAVKRSPETRDIDLPDRGEHQKMQNAMKRMITDFNELPESVLWYAQAMYRDNRDGDEIVLPFIMGKDYEVSAWACAQMQAFGYYRKRSAKVEGGGTVVARELLFDTFVDNSAVEHWAKDRYGVLPRKATIAVGEEQKGTLGQLFALIDADPTAVTRARARVEQRDDSAEPDDDQPTFDEADGAPDPDPDANEPPATPKAAAAKPARVGSTTRVAPMKVGSRPAAKR